MFPWKKKPPQLAEEKPREKPDAGADAAPALEFAAETLRALGEHSFDIDETGADTIREQFDAWARHLLVDAPRPGGGEDSRGRDWQGARRFVWGHRRAERDYVTRTSTDLREALWTFIHAISNAATEDRDTDDVLTQQMTRLREVVSTDRTDAIKHEAVAAVGLLGKVVAERQQRQRARVEELRESLADARGELETTREKMERDPLTDLFNRGALDDQLERMADLGRVFGHSPWLFMIDLDHFKQVNDTYGHPMGDEVLRQLAGRLVRTFLRRDDFIARFGGEEFVAVLKSDSLTDAEGLGERLLQSVRDLVVEHEDQTLSVTISAGVACLSPGESAAAWLERADAALYTAKEAGRDRLCVAPLPETATPD